MKSSSAYNLKGLVHNNAHAWVPWLVHKYGLCYIVGLIYVEVLQIICDRILFFLKIAISLSTFEDTHLGVSSLWLQFANRVHKKSVVISFALHSCRTILRQAMVSVCCAGLLAVLCQRVITTLWYSLLAGSCFSSCWWVVNLRGPTADLPEPFVMETFCSIKLPHTDGRCPQTTLQHKQTAKKLITLQCV